MEDGSEKKIFEFQILQQHLQEVQRRQQMVAERIDELARTKAAFEELKTVKAGDSAMIPLGGENFIPGKIADTNSILVGIGGGVAIKRSVETAGDILDGRISEMERVSCELATEAQSTFSRLTNLQAELEAQHKH